MADVEEKERTAKDWMKILLPRILRAAVWGFIMGGEMLLLIYIAEAGGPFLKLIPIEQESLSYLLVVFVGFEVAIQLLYGTIFQYALSITRALISMIALVFMTNGGIISITLQRSQEIPIPLGTSIIFAIDFKAILGAWLLLSSLSIVKNLLQAIEFLSEKEEEPAIPPEIP